MQNFDFSSKGAHQLIQQWYNAAEKDINTSDRMKLYEETDKWCKSVNTKTKEVCSAFIKEFNEHKNAEGLMDKPTTKLIEWITGNTKFEQSKNENFEGAYKSFHDLFKAIKNVDTPPDILNAINVLSYYKIKEGREGQKIDTDPFKQIFANLSLSEKLAFSMTNKDQLMQFKEQEVSAYNANPVSFMELFKIERLQTNEIKNKYLNDIEKYINLLGDQTNNLTTLNLSGYVPEQTAKLILSKCPNVTKIICDKKSIIDLIKDNEKIKNVEYHWTTNLKDFPQQLLPKVTLIYLSAADDNHLNEMFDLLSVSLPKITMLHITGDITKLPDACYHYMPNLQELSLYCKTLKTVDSIPTLKKIVIGNSCTSLEKVDTMANLQDGHFCGSSVRRVGDMPELKKVDFWNCASLEEVGDMPKLQYGHFGSCKSLKKVGNNKELVNLNFLSCDALEEVGDMPKLQEGYFPHTIKKVGKMPDHLNPLLKK